MTDLRLAVRTLARSPLFALAIILTIGLGVGATTAAFSFVYSALYRPLPYSDADRLVALWVTTPRDPKAGLDEFVSNRIFVNSSLLASWRRDVRAFEDVAGFIGKDFTLAGAGEPARIHGALTTASFFKVLGLRPVVGRFFEAGEDEPGRDEVVVLGYGFWKEHFQGDRKAIGATVRLDGVPHTVIGVVPPDARLPLQYGLGLRAVYTPMSHEFTRTSRFSVLLGIARLKAGTTIEAAQAELSAAMAHRSAASGSRRGARLAPLFAETVVTARGTRRDLLVLLAATVCVLLVGCLNVANLLLVRAGRRHREIAIRTALGAGRWRVMRLVVVESLLLSIAGGAVGLLLAAWGIDLLLALVPDRQFPRLEEVKLDAAVFAFGMLASLLAGAVAALFPAWYALARDRRGRLADSLKESHRSGSASRGARFARRTLVGAQVVVAMVLLIAAGLLARTYVDLLRTDFGVQADHVLTFSVTMNASRYPDSPARAAFARDLLDRLRSLPGVRAAGLADVRPASANVVLSGPDVVDGRPMPGGSDAARTNYATAGFFEAAGVPLVAGRLFGLDPGGSDGVIVSRGFARRLWPRGGADAAIGHTVTFGKSTYPIVGVVGDVKYLGANDEQIRAVYMPHSASFWNNPCVLVRTSGDPLALVPAARRAVHALDADMPVDDVQTMEQVIGDSTTGQRFRLVVIGLFAFLALVLAMIGLYGVVAQSVAQRTQEMGIRLALGAGRGRIIGMVLAEALILVSAGIAGGVVASIGTTRVLSSFLYGVTPTDTMTYAIVAVSLFVVGGAAALAPARHASGINPVVALRDE